MTGKIEAQAGLAALFMLSALSVVVLLVGAAVFELAPLTGLAGALAIVGLGFFGLALAIVLVLRTRARAARKRRHAEASVAAIVELALLPVPRKHLHWLEAEVAAGVGLAALIALLLRPAEATET